MNFLLNIMKVTVYHIQINISNPKISLPFYKKLFSYFEYNIIDESDEHIGASNGTTDFWIIATDKKYLDKQFHRKTTGLNHISFMVNSKEEVDKFVSEFLKKNKIKQLYESPKLFPEYNEEYYAVFFEDSDKIKLEVCYIPKKEEKDRQKDKEKAVVLALQNGMALIRRDLEIYGMKADGSTILLSKSKDYGSLWGDVLNKLKNQAKDKI